MKNLYLSLITVALTLAAFSCHSKNVICSVEQTIQAEKQLAALHSWTDAITYYKANKTCIDGGVGEGYSNFLASKLALRDGASSLWNETAKQRWFRGVVAKKMPSESISLDVTEEIFQNLKPYCPASAKNFCCDLRVKIKKTCPACDQK